MNTATTNLRARATEIARDLVSENNDAPLSAVDLLTVCYIRAFTDGIKHSNQTLAAELQALRS